MTNNWRISHTALLASLLFAAGCGPAFDPSSPGEELEATSNAIVGGQTDQGHDAVAMLYYDDGNNSYLCSGTMIDKRVFLTAGHCTDGVASKYYVLGGTGNLFTSDPDWFVTTAAVHQHPGYNPSTLTRDIGVLILDEDAPVTPYRWLDSNDDDTYSEGTPFTAVGYGITSGNGGGDGTKRTVDMTMTTIYTDIFEYGSATRNTCSGDSGGPALATINGYTTVIGVVSYGDQNCSQFGGDGRTDYNQSFISQYADPNAGGGKKSGGGGSDNPLACSIASVSNHSPLAAGLLALVAFAATFRRRRG